VEESNVAVGRDTPKSPPGGERDRTGLALGGRAVIRHQWEGVTFSVRYHSGGCPIEKSYPPRILSGA